MKHPRRFRGMFLGSVGKQKKGKEAKRGGGKKGGKKGGKRGVERGGIKVTKSKTVRL